MGKNWNKTLGSVNASHQDSGGHRASDIRQCDQIYLPLPFAVAWSEALVLNLRRIDKTAYPATGAINVPPTITTTMFC